MSVKTILSDVVKGFEKLFSAGVKTAEAVEPEIDVLFPGLAGLFNGAVVAGATVEAAAASASAQSGTGTQKLALATAQIEPAVAAYMTANNLVPASGVNAAQVVTQAAVNVMNAFSPAGSVAPVVSPVMVAEHVSPAVGN
jgi:hypothetical protein